ncbi:hypothetical protein BGO18_04060 [Candidatus Saccharibacteria bacterium 47-87]|jgi:hypothetical protein|nr:hypothetical protein [Candidatus Saccharibacteria bacterium]OJU97308.1 MAG: hypothetical protein BGO18_04060 [Candidatus Saccharibacteria bacterium 47-87]
MSNPEHYVGPWQVKYPNELQEKVKEAVEGFEEFLTLEPDAQDVFTISDRFNGFGVERKMGDGSDASGGSHDVKLNFDTTRAGIESLEAAANSIKGADGKIAQGFIKSIASLAEYAHTAISEVGAVIEERSGTIGFRELAKASAGDAYFRFLHYPAGVAVDSIVGEPHPDNSGFTLHLYESTDGCEWLDSDGKTWHPMPVNEGYATTFASMQTQLVTGGEIDALWHRIIANETTHTVGRIAVVCFVSLKDTPKYDRKSHGRLQEFETGSTYGLDPEQFNNLFVKS